jgi:hypothetical protein
MGFEKNVVAGVDRMIESEYGWIEEKLVAGVGFEPTTFGL